MNFKKHFLESHIPQARKEQNCIIDLCGRIAINVKELNREEVNRYKDDLLKSLEALNTMYEVKQQQLDDEEMAIRRQYF